MTERTAETGVRSRWTERLHQFLPEFLSQHPVLSRFRQHASVVLHGSITMGIDDEHADLDLWFLLPEADLAELDAACETRFFAIELDGKPGHLSAESCADFSQRLAGCEMDLIYQLRRAEVLTDEAAVAGKLVRQARTPMRRVVSEALFFYHYVEMRSDHRACDNPMERNGPVALLLLLPKTIAHALRAAIVLDGEPYPYDKWLYRAAAETSTGRQLLPHVQAILDHLAADGLRADGPESDHPIGLELRGMRQTLIDAAHSKGIDEPWLTEWWRFMTQARDVIKDVSWHELR